MRSRILVPPIKSQGIKTKLVPFIESLVPQSLPGRWSAKHGDLRTRASPFREGGVKRVACL